MLPAAATRGAVFAGQAYAKWPAGKFSADHLTLEPDQTSFYQPIVIARKGF